jgi:hypothetical protein
MVKIAIVHLIGREKERGSLEIIPAIVIACTKRGRSWQESRSGYRSGFMNHQRHYVYEEPLRQLFS